MGLTKTTLSPLERDVGPPYDFPKAIETLGARRLVNDSRRVRRGDTFVTEKIAKAAARIKLGLQDKLVLGNLDAVRDWGYAPEYVEGMWRMLQHHQADDFVLATCTAHTVRDFVRFCFEAVDLEWEKYVEVSERYFRPTEVEALLGDPSKAKEKLGSIASGILPLGIKLPGLG